MTLSQGANYLLPLVTLPYITRVIGPDNYGAVEFATVTMLYAAALVTYGFTFTGTRKIAELAEAHSRISTVYSVIMQSKLMLLVGASICLLPLLLYVPQYSLELKLMLFAFPSVIGWALYPDFLFQGRQNLGFIALLNLSIKLAGAILVFILLEEESDYPLVAGINSFTQIMAAVSALWFAHKKYSWLQFRWQRLRLVKAYLRSGFYMFLSLFFTRVYTFGSILFIGFLLPQKDLGLFAAAMKLITVGQSFLFTPVGNALYPYLAAIQKSDPLKFLKDRIRFRNYLLIFAGMISLIIILGREFWVSLLFGEAYLEAAPALALMAPVMVLSALSHFGMKQGLMILKEDGLNLKVVLLTGLFSVALNFALIKGYGFMGAAGAKLALELLLAAFSLYYFNKALSRRKYSLK